MPNFHFSLQSQVLTTTYDSNPFLYDYYIFFSHHFTNKTENMDHLVREEIIILQDLRLRVFFCPFQHPFYHLVLNVLHA